MLRKWICLLWALYLVMGAGGQADAAQQTGTIRISPQWCGRPVAGGAASICLIGGKDEEGYYLTDGLADWRVGEQELNSGEWIDWLSQRQTENMQTVPVTEDSGGVFENLQEGIYLVRQTAAPKQFKGFEPFFLMIPEGENWEVFRAPKLVSIGESPKTGDRPAPLVGAMGIGLSVAFLMVLVDEHKK